MTGSDLRTDRKQGLEGKELVPRGRGLPAEGAEDGGGAAGARSGLPVAAAAGLEGGEQLPRARGIASSSSRSRAQSPPVSGKSGGVELGAPPAPECRAAGFVEAGAAARVELRARAIVSCAARQVARRSGRWGLTV